MTRLAALFLLATLLTPAAHACKCRTQAPLEEHVLTHGLVFVGKVASTAKAGRERRVAFEKLEVLKGGLTVRKVKIRTGLGGGDCGVDFIPGREYLVYAHKVLGGYSSISCDYSKELPAGKAEAARVRELLKR